MRIGSLGSELPRVSGNVQQKRSSVVTSVG